MTYTRPAPGDPGNSGATSATTIIDALSDGLEALENTRVINVLNEGVYRDARHVLVTTTASSTTVTATGSRHPAGANVFSASDVGKAIHIDGAGGSGANLWHKTTIATYVNATTVTVASAPTASVTSYNAVVGSDNTAAIDAVLASALPGDTLYFPGGDYDYLTDGDHNVTTSRVKIKGDGIKSTRFVTTHLTNSVWVFDAGTTDFIPPFNEAHDFTIHHGAWYSLGVSTPSKPTAGAGIKQTCYQFAGNRYWNLNITGMYVGVQIDDGADTRVENCQISAPVYAGITIDCSLKDYGMFRVRDCNFPVDGYSLHPTYGIHWNGGGATWIQGCHFSSQYLQIVFENANWDYTGNLRVVDCSFEDWVTQAVQVIVTPTTSSADLGYIVIASNTLQGGSGGPFALWSSTRGSARSRTGSDHGIAAVSIIGNARYNGSGAMVTLTRCRDVAVVGNTQIGGTVVSQTDCLNVRES